MGRLDDLKEKILPVLLPCGVRRVALFGSFARGEEAPGSDVDILVDLKRPGERPRLGLKWFAVEEELGRRLGRDVELVTEASLSPYVRPYVEKDMVTLYEEG
ncbi:MAG: nucleotidyltransferase family protein [Deltaproteobacteria bacterium]|nr:nucleotidyltransferase family protein [Deltaproteobacteria bacterium]